MIPYGHQYIDKDDINAVVKVLKSDWLTQGPKVLEFEKKLAVYCGAKYAVSVSHGTAALHLAYLVGGIGAGDEVITTPNTFAATVNMVLAVGAKPVFCDISLDTYNIDETKIEKRITKKTRGIVPVHFAGQPCRMDVIHRIAKRHKLIVIEDACQALGAKYRDKKIGSLSDMTVFSFHPVKSITTGEGGAIATDSQKFYKLLKLLSTHGIHKDAKGKSVMTELGYNYRMTDLQAALGESQLRKLDGFIKKRHQVAQWYEEALQGMKDITLPRCIPESYSACHIYVIRVKRSLRDSLASYLYKKGVGVNFHHKPVHTFSYYRQNGFRHVHMPMAEKYYRCCLTLPLYPALRLSGVRYISSAIKEFFRKYG